MPVKFAHLPWTSSPASWHSIQLQIALDTRTAHRRTEWYVEWFNRKILFDHSAICVNKAKNEYHIWWSLNTGYLHWDLLAARIRMAWVERVTGRESGQEISALSFGQDGVLFHRCHVLGLCAYSSLVLRAVLTGDAIWRREWRDEN